MNTAFEYLKLQMEYLSNILYNGSQDHISKDDILDSISRMIIDYNSSVSEGNRIKIIDFRKK